MKPDFTGTWTLIPNQSDFGFLAPPRLRIDTVSHAGSELNIQTRQKDANGDITLDRNLTIGADPVQILIHNRQRLIRAFWDNNILVIETTSEVSGNPRRIEDRWSLDTDQNWLTIHRRHEQPGGRVHQRLRLQREI